MSQRPRILYLVTDDWFFWSHRLHLARAARDAGWQVVVATSAGAFRPAIEAEGFLFEPLRFRRTVAGQLGNVLALPALVRLYRRAAPDIVHHVSFLPIFFGSIAARLARVPSTLNAVTGLGAAFIDKRPRSFVRLLMEWGYAFALRGPRVHALFQNPDDEKLFRERGLLGEGPRSVVAGSGVDVARFAPAPEPAGPPVVLLASRMLWSKGVGVLVEAGRLLAARGIPHVIRLAGQPHPTNPDSIPESDLAAWNRAGLAEWVGQRDDVPSLIRSACVVCLPSYYREGVPLALIEGAACGRPLVSTDAPGCREIVLDGENGLLVPERDPRALADALERLLADAALRARMGAAGRALVEARFSKEVVNAEILAIYAGLRAPARPAPALVPELLVDPPAPLPAARSVVSRRDVS